MLTLFIDTHSENVTIAIIKDNQIISEKTVREAHSHSTICIPTLIEVFDNCTYKINDLNSIVVVNGPGSFTGERLGVAIAKTTAYSLNLEVRTLTSIETCLANMNINQDTYLAISEKNGYFLAKYNSKKELINDYFYLKKSEYEEFITQNNCLLCKEYDVVAAISYALSKKQAINPHIVNPFYVKKIEVEK